jgi:hypothetical protein
VKQALDKQHLKAEFEGFCKKGGQFPKSSIKQAISSALTNRKGTVKMGPKNRGKNAAQSHPKRSRKSAQNELEIAA